jgi:branched-chain amino acid aminotransferase
MDVPFSAKAIEEAVVKLTKDNAFKDDTYVRPLVYPGDFFELMGGKAPIDVSIFAVPYNSQDHSQKVEKGIKCCVSSWRKISDSSLPARVKTCGNYVNSRLAKNEARISGFDDAILLTKDGFVSEGSGANLFLVKNNGLVTPDVSFDILEGITRDSIMKIADDLGITVRERGVVRSELYAADEVFLCGTVAEVLPVVSIDNIAVNDGKPGNLTKNLQNHFFKIARGESPKHNDWLRAIHKR